ncbi:hypothetical protein ABH905_000708 [Pseudomonas frederiksbergensis]|uniref:hypothetical protein n=1 Tax=Pseudomonas frederiksbergensis TaxID=104087 RepID=UPI003D1BF1B6
MRAVWNPYIGFTHLSWACVSYLVTFAMLGLIFFPFLSLGRYVIGWPIGVSILVSVALSMICSFSKRDYKVSVSVVPQGLMFRDEAAGYKRQELIRREEICSVHVRRNPFFKSLVINLKEKNQRFSLSNVALTDDFLARVRAHINVEN